MEDNFFSPLTKELLKMAKLKAIELEREFITPEIVLLCLLHQKKFRDAILEAEPLADIKSITEQIIKKIKEQPAATDNQFGIKSDTLPSHELTEAINEAHESAVASEAWIDVPFLIMAIQNLRHSWAAYLLNSCLGENACDFMNYILEDFDEGKPDIYTPNTFDPPTDPLDEDHNQPHNNNTDKDLPAAKEEQPEWKQWVTSISDTYKAHNPLIGRTEELARTIRVLCRKDKNNPLHLGEPGVGKTALIYGLAAMIDNGEVPEGLTGSRIYMIDMGTMLAGTQYRGDFEKRFKSVLDGAAQEKNAIIYIDEIHTIMGAGQTSDGSMDASNLLKPYLESGTLRFIGATTHEEYNRYIQRSRGIMRRFQTIEVDEPSIDETVRIINALKPAYEQFHGVTYADGTVEYAVRMTAKHITDRCLPDKAIDLIDEAGAFLHAQKEHTQTVVTLELMAKELARIAKVDALTLDKDADQRLESLAERIQAVVYGQDTAVQTVVEAVQMAKAGLTEDGKPLASLLFVGPTGVGKTEVARTLANELGVELVRFDMSEFAEKHSVAKFIGSPAGYIGYDDGGQLTDAVRRHPDCVLLLDEIEKAHPDVFDILLQVMDYGVLTDNKGRKAHFQNVVLIMTSNAGAQYARQASVGFASNVSTGDAMLTQVKKIFKPEFINRLSSIVVFNDMDRHMASLVLKKKLRQLTDKLSSKAVTLTIESDALERLLDLGFSAEYGAREMDRVIHREIKSLLVRQILFGPLKQGGPAKLTLDPDGKLTVATPLRVS